MNSTLLTVLSIGLIIVASHLALGEDSSYPAQFQRQRNTCGDLCKPTGYGVRKGGSGEASSSNTNPKSSESGSVSGGSTEGSGSGQQQCTCAPQEGSGSTEATGSTAEASGSTNAPGSGNEVAPVDCELTDWLYNISVSVLSAEQQEIFEEWIYQIQITILADASLTFDEMIVQISYSLQLFFSEHEDIEALILYEQIGDFGCINDFLHVAILINLENVPAIVTLDSEGSCLLFEALLNATAGNEEEYQAVEELIANITAILQINEWSFAQQQAAIYELFIEFFSVNAEWKSFFESIQITGFGSLQMYLDVCLTYERITTVSVVIGGEVTTTDSSSCVLLSAFQTASQNTSYSVSVRAQFTQIYQVLLKYFVNTTDINARLAYVAQEVFSQNELVVFFLQFVDQVECGDWGFFYELTFGYSVCINEGCGSIDNGPGTLPPASTTPAAGTTIQPHSCATVTNLFVIDVQTNTTDFLNTIISVTNNWNATSKVSIQSTINSYKKAIYSSASITEIYQSCVNISKQYNTNNQAKQAQLFNIFFSSWQGTVSDVCACQSQVQ